MISDEVNESKEEVKKPQEIAYYRVSFWKRITCIVFDLLICALICAGLFLGLRAIVNNSSKGKAYYSELNSLKEESGIYVYNASTGLYQDLVTYYNASTDISYGAKELGLQQAIDNFYTFLEGKMDEEKFQLIKEDYDNYRIDESLNYEGNAYFILDEETNQVIKNEEAKISSKNYVENVYKPYFDNKILSYFITYVPGVYDMEKYFSNMLLFMEIPVSLTISVTIIYYIVPLCFYRNKATLGRFLLKIGLVDKDVLSVKFWRFTLRFAIFLIAEVWLSLVTFGVPLFVSFSLMAFSKKKQNFHDYMLGIEEVDVENSKIYYSKSEIYAPKNNVYDVSNFRMK